MKEYFDVIFEFEANDDCKSTLDRIKMLSTNQKRVWLLLSRKDKSNWECLQVAQTKNNIISEISKDVEFMLNFNYSNLPKDESVSKSSAFYEKVYDIDKKVAANADERRKYMYSKMKEEYSYFMICILKVDEYLDLVDISIDNKNILNMISIAKNLYAEAMIAYDMLAKYWNMYNSGVDGQAIMCFWEK